MPATGSSSRSPSRLRATVPAGATLARVGGDEFVIAHLGTQTEAVALAERS